MKTQKIGYFGKDEPKSWFPNRKPNFDIQFSRFWNTRLPNKPLPPRPRSSCFAVSPRRGEEGTLGRPSGRKNISNKPQATTEGTKMYVMTISVDDLFDSITANQMSLYDTIWSYAEDAVNHNGTVLIQQIYANAKPDLIERIQTPDQLMNAKQKYDEIYLKIQH